MPEGPNARPTAVVPPAQPAPTDEARRIVDDFRREIAWPLSFMRIVTNLPPEERRVLRQVVNQVHEERQQPRPEEAELPDVKAL